MFKTTPLFDPQTGKKMAEIILKILTVPTYSKMLNTILYVKKLANRIENHKQLFMIVN